MFRSLKVLIFALLALAFVVPSTFSMHAFHHFFHHSFHQEDSNENKHEHCENKHEHCEANEDKHEHLDAYSYISFSDLHNIEHMCCNHNASSKCHSCGTHNCNLRLINNQRQLARNSSIKLKRLDVELLCFIEKLIPKEFHFHKTFNIPTFCELRDFRSSYFTTIRNICILII